VPMWKIPFDKGTTQIVYLLEALGVRDSRRAPLPERYAEIRGLLLRAQKRASWTSTVEYDKRAWN